MDISIPRPKMGTFEVKVKGMIGSTLIMNPKTDEDMQKIKDKQLKKATKGREAKDPDKIFKTKIIVNEKGKVSALSNWFKTAMISASKIAELKMTDMRKAFFIMDEHIPLENHSQPRKREDFLPLNRGGTDWKIRAEIDEWEATLKINHNINFISAEQLVNLLSLAGFHCGVGDNRPNSPKCSGNHGRFELVTNSKKKQ